MITDYDSYITYFETIAAEHLSINDFVYGGSQRILARETSDLAYPVLWLEIPDVVPFTGDSDLRLRFAGGMMILQNTPQDFDEEDDAMNITYGIAIGIIQRLMDDAENGLFDFDPTNAVLQAKPPFSGDNDHGWHIDFDISISASACLNESDWEE